jgi:hypothetical protein
LRRRSRGRRRDSAMPAAKVPMRYRGVPNGAARRRRLPAPGAGQVQDFGSGTGAPRVRWTAMVRKRSPVLVRQRASAKPLVEASHSGSMTNPRRSWTGPRSTPLHDIPPGSLRDRSSPHNRVTRGRGGGARGACRGLRGEASSRQNVPRIARRRGGRRSPRRGRLPGSSAACLRRGAPSRAACGRAWTRRPAGTRRRVLAAGVRELPHGPTSGSDATAASCGPWSRRFMDNRAASD